MSRLKNTARLVAWLLPSSNSKTALLRALGHDIHPTAVAKPNLVWKVDRFTMAPGSRIGLLNVIKDMSMIEIGERAAIGRWNVISSHPVFQRLYATGARLVLGPRSKITSHHHVDCSGGVAVGELSSIAGHNSRLMTHSVDLTRDVQAAYPITIGDRSFVATRSLLLGGAVLPSRSMLAAGSVLLAARDDQRSGLWAGSPAVFKRELQGEWFDRANTSTRRVLIPQTGEIVEDAL